MADDNTLNFILEKLNSPDMSDTLKNVLDSFSSDKTFDDNDSCQNNDIFSNILSSIGSSNLDLLIALKPYLNEKRQKKIDQCENFISIIKTFDILKQFTQDEDS